MVTSPKDIFTYPSYTRVTDPDMVHGHISGTDYFMVWAKTQAMVRDIYQDNPCSGMALRHLSGHMWQA